MKYKAVIEAVDNGNIEKIFKAEDKDFMNDRSSYEVERNGETTVFKVQADDATALRATLDAIAKNLKVYEKMGEIQ